MNSSSLSSLSSFSSSLIGSGDGGETCAPEEAVNAGRASNPEKASANADAAEAPAAERLAEADAADAFEEPDAAEALEEADAAEAAGEAGAAGQPPAAFHAFTIGCCCAST